jgi:septal ring factor EnvC (AmiA/AmiB activator)
MGAGMAEVHRNELSRRLWRLPRQLLLALVNATAILVIVAAVLALVAMSRIDNFAHDVAATTTEAVLSRIDLPAKDVLANLRTLTAEVHNLGNTLREFRTGEQSPIQAEIARLNERLRALSINIDQLTNARSALTDEAIVRLGQSVTDRLLKLRHCNSSTGVVAPRAKIDRSAVALSLNP